VIPEAADASMYPRSPAEIGRCARLGLPERYLLSVGGLEHPEARARTSRASPRLPASCRW
jgi:hypothetical protein